MRRGSRPLLEILLNRTWRSMKNEDGEDEAGMGWDGVVDERGAQKLIERVVGVGSGNEIRRTDGHNYHHVVVYSTSVA